MKKALSRVVLVGPIRSYVKPKIQKDDFVIAVDGGLDQALRWKLRPSLAIGDWDSLTSKAKLKKTKNTISLDSKKNRSDFYYALQFAASLNSKKIICLGFGGGRLDHELGVYFDLIEFKHLNCIVELHSDRGKSLIFPKGGVTYETPIRKNHWFSLFALQGSVKGLSLSGAEYSAQNLTLPPSTHGLSNRMSRNTLKIRFNRGKLLLVIPS